MRQWAILIGLNQYQMFQPLTCAQQDAQALHQAFIHDVGLPPEQCLLLTDTSPPISGRPTQPTRTNLQNWLELLTQHSFKPGDTLWFFFSGYGVCAQGRDYLVPLDGDPFAVETTCILMSDIFSRLQAAVSPGLLLAVFDINRIQGNYSNENVGMQSARLAKQLAVPMILSCHPGQYSREISGLGQGLFTIALLDALRYHQAATPATLMRFLGDRIPELGAYYYLPNQQPFCFCPADKLHQPLLKAHFAGHGSGDNNGNGNHALGVTDAPPIQPTPVASTAITASADRSKASVSIPHASQTQLPPVTNPALFPATRVDQLLDSLDQPLQVSANPHSPAIGIDPQQATIPNGQSPYAVATIPTAQASAATTPPAKSSPLPPPSAVMPQPTSSPIPPVAQASSETTPTPRLENSATTPQDDGSSVLWKPILFWSGLLSLGLIGCVLWRNWSEIQVPSSVSTPSPTVILPVPSPSPALSPPLENTPLPPPTVAPPTVTPAPTPSPAAVSPPPPAPDRVVDFNPAPAPNPNSGQDILLASKSKVLSDQATPYRDAIDILKQIPNTDPAYAEAQQDIARWSQRIFDIAKQRAAQKQLDIAIMAADLVPADNPSLYSQSRELIAQWCPVIQPQPVTMFPMRRAKEICNQKPI